MRLHLPTTAIAAAALLAIGASTSTAAADKPRVNGWYPCAFSSKTDPAKYGTSFQNMTVFECAEIEVPLCYEGLCDSDWLIDVFVKRRLAKNKDGASKAIILLEGGPGYAATGMESRIEKLTTLLDDTVDFYTIDHRGTGRSEFLDCEAAQALTAGSPGGKGISQDELLSCLKDLNFKYQGQAAGFSTTSVAMDIRAMIDLFMAKQDVYVAGFSYGTYVAQRVLQLNVPQVKGYVFDGVDALSVKGDAVETANSNWNEGLAAPSRRLLEFCFDDEKCPVKFNKRETVLEEVLVLMDKLDKEVETNKCAKILADATGYDEPSAGLRTWMNERVTSVSTRADTLKMLGHAQRCNDEDAKEMQKVFDEENAEKEEEETGDVPDELNDVSALLYNVIVFSERWAQPAPTQEQRDAFFYGTAYATDDDSDAQQYCLFTGSTEPACEELKDELPANHKDTFFYKRDKYYSAPLTLPSRAGALILNGGLDFQTPREFGELLYSKLDGSGQGVMMVNFDYGVHCWGEAVPENTQKPCYYSIIAGLVENDGDVTAIDTNCMAELPDTVFH